MSATVGVPPLLLRPWARLPPLPKSTEHFLSHETRAETVKDRSLSVNVCLCCYVSSQCTADRGTGMFPSTEGRGGGPPVATRGRRWLSGAAPSISRVQFVCKSCGEIIGWLGPAINIINTEEGWISVKEVNSDLGSPKGLIFTALVTVSDLPHQFFPGGIRTHVPSIPHEISIRRVRSCQQRTSRGDTPRGRALDRRNRPPPLPLSQGVVVRIKARTETMEIILMTTVHSLHVKTETMELILMTTIHSLHVRTETMELILITTVHSLHVRTETMELIICTTVHSLHVRTDTMELILMTTVHSLHVRTETMELILITVHSLHVKTDTMELILMTTVHSLHVRTETMELILITVHSLHVRTETMELILMATVHSLHVRTDTMELILITVHSLHVRTETMELILITVHCLHVRTETMELILMTTVHSLHRGSGKVRGSERGLTAPNHCQLLGARTLTLRCRQERFMLRVPSIVSDADTPREECPTPWTALKFRDLSMLSRYATAPPSVTSSRTSSGLHLYDNAGHEE
uniref:Uncharacterized protein n=1 Tax=Timema genevievae TaxID=629358 RepID=A0A7R9K281_TIMGE|nr:unnamed protein product [Timema genevievae]